MKKAVVLILICAMCMPLFIACEFAGNSDKALFFTSKTSITDVYASVLKNIIGIEGMPEIANATGNMSMSLEAGVNSLILSGEEMLPGKISSMLTLAANDDKDIMLNASVSVADESINASMFFIDEGIVIEAKEILSKAIFGTYQDVLGMDEESYKTFTETVETALADSFKSIEKSKDQVAKQQKELDSLLQTYGKVIYDWVPDNRISSEDRDTSIYGSKVVNTKKITLRLSANDMSDLVLVLIDKAIDDKNLQSYITKYSEGTVVWDDVVSSLKILQNSLEETANVGESNWIQIDRYINNKVSFREKVTIHTRYGKEYDTLTYDAGFMSENGKDRGYVQVTEKSKHYSYYSYPIVSCDTDDTVPEKDEKMLVTTESLLIDANYKSDGVKSEININGEYGDKLKIESVKGKEDTEHNVRWYDDYNSEDISFKLNTSVVDTAEDFKYSVRFRYEDKEEDNSIDCWSAIHLNNSKESKVNVPDLKNTYNLASEEDMLKVVEELQKWFDNNQNGAFADLLNLFMVNLTTAE